ncbi:MAG: hypothetical protein PHH82_01660 [Candidatus ainarchaeum sp.]|nr:hypothetical protein [Candidatus ainarchaeum sp.]
MDCIGEKVKIISLEQGTCTDIACQYFVKNIFKKNAEIVYVSSYPELEKLAKKEKNSLVLLPHINPLCIKLEHDPKWKTQVDLKFSLQNPPIYLAKNGLQKQNNFCATIPILQQLIKPTDLVFVSAKNTQNAAEIAKKGACTFCITNENGIKKTNLIIIKELKKILVTWIPFCYIGNLSK